MPFPAELSSGVRGVRSLFFRMDFQITGEVVGGNRLGRRLGFPTANLAVGESVPARNGVYAAHFTVDGKVWPAMVNLGRKPTVGSGLDRVLEAHVLGFDGDLYGRTVTVDLLEFVRSERKFGSVEELRRQIEADRAQIVRFFEKNGKKNDNHPKIRNYHSIHD